MKINVVYNGDCVKVLNEHVESGSVSLVFADPPYNISGVEMKLVGNKTGGDWRKVNEEWDEIPREKYLDFTKSWISSCHRALKDNGSIYVCSTFHNLGEILLALKGCGFKLNNVITWQKVNAMPNMTRRVFTHSTEFVVWAVKGKGWVFNYQEIKALNPDKQKDGNIKQMRDVWAMPLVQGRERLRDNEGRTLHSTQKPEEMLRRVIVASSNAGDLVLDPFLGSGTTAAVAKRLGRNWIGIELDKKYAEAAKKRIAAVRP